VFDARERKESCISAKEPYIPAKVPYVSADKKTFLPTTI